MSERQDGPVKEKQKYEPPLLVNLGELAKGVGGGNCSLGSSPTGATCLSGGGAQALCTVGAAVVG